MKFGHVFKQQLKQEGFPPDWVESAISYSQLKKVINRLTLELADVGLDPETLRKVLKQVEDSSAAAANGHVEGDQWPVEYVLSEDGASTARRREPFQPKLLFYINESTGDLLGAHLDRETREKLQALAVQSGLSHVRVYEEPDSTNSDAKSCLSAESLYASGRTTPCKRTGYKTVEVALTSDSEFFTKLSKELSGLEALQKQEGARLHGEIEELGRQVARLVDPEKRTHKKEHRQNLTVWRQIFQMYIESDVFFGSTERDHAAHDADKAAEHFQKFANQIKEAGLVDKLKKPESLTALTHFMHINSEILQGLRFGEINRTAMLKILKKFDKQTALSVKSTFPKQIQYPEFSENLAKAVCAEVSSQVLNAIPRLDDYSCPMCMEIEWRPVRLRCGHVFCIRCLIVMQNKEQHNCPLCRERTVIDANSEHLDLALAEYLKKWFPEEVKAKQKYNELMAGIEEYGEAYNTKCVVM